MAEIATRPANGLVAVGTFSGCGGSSLGLKMAGWSVPYAVEFVGEAANTYEANFPEAVVDRRDVRQITGQEILETIELSPGELDLLEGSPPCASFSHAGSRSKAWGLEKTYSQGKGAPKQRTDDLFWEWTRLLEELRPRAMLAENVPGMLNGRALEEYAHKIVQEMKDLGYRVSARVVNAAWYGVPQDRERLLFMGLREDVAEAVDVGLPEFPPQTIDEPRTIKEALDAAVPLDPNEVRECFKEDTKLGHSWKAIVESRERYGAEPDYPRLPCNRCGEVLNRHRDYRQTDSGYPMGATCADGEPAELTKMYFMLRVPKLEEPSPTIVAMSDAWHPTECRHLTIRELLAVGAFPPDFELTGRRPEKRERIGRAVPPPVYEAMGKRIADYLTGHGGDVPAMFSDSRPASRELPPESRTY
jgi:DNA (cytosine-5)-methyltransferase 1